MPALPRKVLLSCLAALLGAACGNGGDGGSPSSGLAPGTITGRERLNWSQQAPDGDELRSYTFVLYVDDRPNDLSGATCGDLAGAGPAAACSSTLPPLTTGQHKLELATRVSVNGEVVESVRSAPLVVTVAGASATGVTAAAFAAPAAPRASLRIEAPPAGDGVELVVGGLDRPTSLAALPDGRLLIAEQTGRIRVVDGTLLQQRLALELPDADEWATGGVAIAIGSDFASSRHVYVAYVVRGPDGARAGRVLRCREVGGILGELAVIVDELPVEAGAPGVHVGPDGALLVALPATSVSDAADPGTFAGKILRLTPAGSTPEDNPSRFSPVLSSGHASRVHFARQPGRDVLWSAEADGIGVVMAAAPRARAGDRRWRLALPSVAGMVFREEERAGRRQAGVYLASPADESLYRVGLPGADSSGPTVERIDARRYGRPTAVAASGDRLYFAVDSPGAQAGSGAVYRLPFGASSFAPR